MQDRNTIKDNPSDVNINKPKPISVNQREIDRMGSKTAPIDCNFVMKYFNLRN
jgi:hypothetical protein